MRKRLIGIAALLMVLLTMPASRACAFAAQRTSVEQDCCPHKVADACCSKAFTLCHATQAPVDATQLPGQDASQLVLPPAALVVVTQDRLTDFKPRLGSLRLPMDHTPPGLLIAATAVLRT